MVRTNLDGQSDACTDECAHTQTLKCRCDNFVLLTARGLHKNDTTSVLKCTRQSEVVLFCNYRI